MQASTQEAMFWEPQPKNAVRCTLCPHFCRIKAGFYGACGVRKNEGGKLYTLVYELAAAANVDPIEKKPLFHFFPGSRSMSIATVGCNFKCAFCQNWDLSQASKGIERNLAGRKVAPAEVVALARQYDCRTVSFTYSEPTIFYEYAYDTARLAAEARIWGVFVTNGYITPEPLEKIRPFLFALNVDLKSFNPDYYLRVVGGKLQPVLDSLKKMKELGFWLEITTLVVPTKNDSDDELGKIAEFIRSLGPEVPWHVSAFHPDYKMTDLPRTSVTKLRRARQIGLNAGLRYVYTGNIPGDEGECTFCYHCGAMVIQRRGFSILDNRIANGTCPDCGTVIDGVGLDPHGQGKADLRAGPT
jgi:pyruvate formate lyase activating enzyme